MEDFN